MTASGERASWRLPRGVWFVLAASFAVRAVLCLKGGQSYFPDEVRYYRSVQLGRLLAGGEWLDALRQPFEDVVHLGMTPTALPPVAVQYALDLVGGLPTSGTLWIGGLYFSLLSVAGILMTHLIARRAGAGEREALLAATLMAMSTTLIYWSRHLVPYHAALLLNLYSVWIGLVDGERPWRRFAGGAVAALAITTYNGGWAGTGAVLAFHVAYRCASVRELSVRGTAAAVGFVTPSIFLEGASRLLGQGSYLAALARFSETATQGEMYEGWTLPWTFLWHAEGGVLLAWLAAGAVALYTARAHKVPGHRAYTWAAMVLLVWGLLALGSTVLGRMVVYGRSTHMMIPFVCLLAGVGLDRMCEMPRVRRWLWTGISLLLLLLAVNLRVPLTQEYPADFLRRARAAFPEASVTSTVGPWPAAALPDSGILIVNASYFFPVGELRDLPAAERLWQARHPDEYRPYQYEGRTRAERARLRAGDISMRVERHVPPSIR